MQAGLLSTYHNAVQSRRVVAWLVSFLLAAFYVLLYFGPIPWLGIRIDVFESAAQAMGLGSKWLLYGILYTLAMIAGGVFFLRRHGNSRYERIRTLSVLFVQIVF